jgi:hypothetical protein
MDSRSRFTFLVLVLAQAAHSVEEYTFKLYDVFVPARFVSGLVSDDLRTGFAIVNIGLVAFGVWCYLARVRPNHRSARQWVWPWVFVEGANGLGHFVLALGRGEYFPGVLTAPLLFATSLYLGIRLVQTQRRWPADV